MRSSSAPVRIPPPPPGPMITIYSTGSDPFRIQFSAPTMAQQVLNNLTEALTDRVAFHKLFMDSGYLLVIPSHITRIEVQGL